MDTGLIRFCTFGISYLSVTLIYIDFLIFSEIIPRFFVLRPPIYKPSPPSKSVWVEQLSILITARHVFR